MCVPAAEPAAAEPAASDPVAAMTSSEAAVAVTDEVRAKILRQIEYYFCDLAFPYDDFLRAQADESGAVPAATLADSPRLKELLSGQTDEQRRVLIMEVVGSESDSVKLIEDRLMRIYPVPKEDPAADSSCYIAGLSKKADEATLIAMMSSATGSDGCEASSVSATAEGAPGRAGRRRPHSTRACRRTP